MSASLMCYVMNDRNLRGDDRLAYFSAADNNGSVKPESVARWCGCPQDEALEIIDRLIARGVFKIEGDVVLQPALAAYHDEEMTGGARAGGDSGWISRNRRNAIYARDGMKCHYCGSSESLTLDHKKPRSRGGDHSDENLVTCCSACNTAKGTASYEDFIEKFQLEVTQ